MKNRPWSHYEKASPATQRVLPHRSEVPLWVPFTALCPCPPQQTLDLVLALREEAAIVSCIGGRIIQGRQMAQKSPPLPAPPAGCPGGLWSTKEREP